MLKRLLGIVAAICVLFVLMIVRPILRASSNMDRGEKLAASGDYDGAYYAFGDAIRQAPDNPWPYFRRAAAMHRSGQYNKSLVDLNDAIRMKPDFGAAYRLRARSNEAQGLIEKAAADDKMADDYNAPQLLEEIYALKE